MDTEVLDEPPAPSAPPMTPSAQGTAKRDESLSEWFCNCGACSVFEENTPVLACCAVSTCMYLCLPQTLAAFAAGTYLGGVLDYATNWGFHVVCTTWPPLQNNARSICTSVTRKLKRE